MKKILILVYVLIFCSISTIKAQENTPTEEMQYFYCEIIGTQKMLSNKVTVVIDFGQVNKFASDQRLRNDKGKIMVFNSMVDAMNWMGARSWEFVQAYVVTNGNNQNVYHWLLKKSTKKMSEEERKGLEDIFKTKQNFKNQD